MPDSPGIIPVEIRGQRYPIRSHLDPRYVAELATYVDEKMRAAAESTPTTDALRLAVLAALNIADEYFRCQESLQIKKGALAERAQKIEQLVDQALRGMEEIGGDRRAIPISSHLLYLFPSFP